MRIVIATGGSGGHLFPALRVGIELRNLKHDVFFLGSLGVGVEQIKKNGFLFQHLTARGFKSKNPIEVLLVVWAMFKAIVSSLRFLRTYKPDAVIGFGGYGAFPGMMGAVLLGYPTLIHEQNVIPGKANRLLAKLVGKIAISFQATTKYLNPRKCVLTGCPTNFQLSKLNKKEILKSFYLEDNKITLLVFGGSQGSQKINKVFLATAALLKSKINFQVIHACGKNNFNDIKKQYEQLGVHCATYEFLENISDAYQMADLVICRSGALTVTEVALFEKKAIFIPYPFAHGHQIENAKVLEDTGLAKIIKEDVLTPETLEQAILSSLNKSFSVQEIEQKLTEIRFPAGAFNVAQEILKFANEK